MKRHLSLDFALVLSLGALGAAGCDPGFLPSSYLNDLRVLAVVADPPEVGPGEPIRLTPYTFVPSRHQVVAERWSFCPLSLGAASGFACAVPSCELSLGPADDGSLELDPLALIGACAASLGSSPPQSPSALPSLPAELPSEIELVVGYQVEASDSSTRDAVMRVPFWTRQTPQPRNRHPSIVAVEIGGQVVEAGQGAAPVASDQSVTVKVRVDPKSLDSFTDESGRPRTEEPIVSFFATAGRFEQDRGAGPEVSVSWRAEELEPGQQQAALYVVVRDLRGGQAVAGPFDLPIQR